MIQELAVSTILYYFEKTSPKYLLLKYKVHGQTHWDFLKGKMEEGEGIVDTAKREALEETKIKDIIIMRRFKEESRYQYQKDTGERVKRKVVYLLSEISKEKSRHVKISEEHQEFKWVKYHQAKRLLEFPNQKQILDKANSFIEAGILI